MLMCLKRRYGMGLKRRMNENTVSRKGRKENEAHPHLPEGKELSAQPSLFKSLLISARF